MRAFFLEILADVWWHVKNMFLVYVFTLPPAWLVNFVHPWDRALDHDPVFWAVVAPGMLYCTVRAWRYEGQKRRGRSTRKWNQIQK